MSDDFYKKHRQSQGAKGAPIEATDELVALATKLVAAAGDAVDPFEKQTADEQQYWLRQAANQEM